MIDQSVGDVMTRPVRTITGEMTASAVARLFAEEGVGSAVVVDSAEEREDAPGVDDVVGIVTESDLMHQIAADADVTAVTVDSFVSTPVVTVESTQSIHEAATLMKDHSIRRLPVVDDGDLVGILTTTDLTHYLPRLRNAVLRSRGELAGQ